MARDGLKHPDIEPTHPGEVLREDTFPALNLTVAAAAKHLGISRQVLHRILAGTAPVTPSTAPQIGKLCGHGPKLWIRMQEAYDLWHAERTMREDLAKIPTLSEAA